MIILDSSALMSFFWGPTIEDGTDRDDDTELEALILEVESVDLVDNVVDLELDVFNPEDNDDPEDAMDLLRGLSRVEIEDDVTKLFLVSIVLESFLSRLS